MHTFSQCVCSVAGSCLALWDPMDCSPPGSSVRGILQARILEWVAMPSSRGSSWPRESNPGLPHCRWRGSAAGPLVITNDRHFPGGPGGEDTTLPLEEAWVLSPVRELRSPHAAKLGQNIKTNKHTTTKNQARLISEVQGTLVHDAPTKHLASPPGRGHSQERVGEEAGAGGALHAFLTPQHGLLTSGLLGRERQGRGTQALRWRTALFVGQGRARRKKGHFQRVEELRINHAEEIKLPLSSLRCNWFVKTELGTERSPAQGNTWFRQMIIYF